MGEVLTHQSLDRRWSRCLYAAPRVYMVYHRHGARGTSQERAGSSSPHHFGGVYAMLVGIQMVRVVLPASYVVVLYTIWWRGDLHVYAGTPLHATATYYTTPMDSRRTACLCTLGRWSGDRCSRPCSGRCNHQVVYDNTM